VSYMLPKHAAGSTLMLLKIHPSVQPLATGKLRTCSSAELLTVDRCDTVQGRARSAGAAGLEQRGRQPCSVWAGAQRGTPPGLGAGRVDGDIA
jgi:hypothetical protein